MRLSTVTFTGIITPEIIPDADMVSYAVVVELLHPVFSNELAVSEKAVEALYAKEPDIVLHQLYPLPCWHISLQHTEPQHFSLLQDNKQRCEFCVRAKLLFFFKKILYVSDNSLFLRLC